MNETNFDRQRESEISSDSNGESTDGSYENYGRNGIRNHDLNRARCSFIILVYDFTPVKVIQPLLAVSGHELDRFMENSSNQNLLVPIPFCSN